MTCRSAGLGPNGSLVNPVIQNYITKYLPMPNIGTNGFISSPKQPTDDDQGIAHIDHNFGTKDTLSFVYLIDNNRTIYPLPQPISSPLGGANSTDFTNQIGTLTWNHIFSPTITNEFRFAPIARTLFRRFLRTPPRPLPSASPTSIPMIPAAFRLRYSLLLTSTWDLRCRVPRG